MAKFFKKSLTLVEIGQTSTKTGTYHKNHENIIKIELKKKKL